MKRRKSALPPGVKATRLLCRRHSSAEAARVAVCIGCGCDDRHACLDGLDVPCGWVLVDRALDIGICNGHAITDQMRCAYRRLRKLLLAGARARAETLRSLEVHLHPAPGALRPRAAGAA
jgi:hypothetical protein